MGESNVTFEAEMIESSVDFEPWHYGACPDKESWADVKVQCEGCQALVNHQFYGATCDEYCKSMGLQCQGAWEEVNNDCEVKFWSECSQPIFGTSDAICECINPCSETGAECTNSKCCNRQSDSCFETTANSA